MKPEFVVITEPTDGNIYRGQRGRMEIRVDVDGISCHGSAPERGDNAIYKMGDILQDVRALNDKLHFDPFLGKGTLTVSEIFFTSPSRCAVAAVSYTHLDVYKRQSLQDPAKNIQIHLLRKAHDV